MDNQLIKVIDESGLDKTKAQVLLANFSNYFEIAADWEAKTKALIVTDISQKAEMQMARTGRLFLKEKRIAVEKTRKSLKENALREGQTIDAIAKILANLILPIEEDLEQKEKFAEIQEAKIRAELKANREMELQPFLEFVPYGLDFGTMPEENYTKVLAGAKLQMQAKLDLEAKEEAERIAKEKAEADERERIRLENIRLKEEAEIKEKELAAERAKAESERKSIEEKAAKEREDAERKLREEQARAKQEADKAAAERAKLEAEIRAKKEADEKARKGAEEKAIADQRAKELANRKAKNAPDKEKLIALAISIEGLSLPEIRGEEAAKILSDVSGLLTKVTVYIRQKSETL